MNTKRSFILIVGIVLGFSNQATSGNLVVKHSGNVVYSVNEIGVISFAKNVVERSTVPAGTQALKISRSAEMLLWTADADQVNIKGQFIDPVPDTSAWIMFRNIATGKRASVTDEGDIPLFGGEQYLVKKDLYLGNHIIQNDLTKGAVVEYCNFGDGRIEYPTVGDHVEEKKIFYHIDHLGSNRMSVDATGRAIEVLSYDAYGAILKDDIVAGTELSTKNKFTGKEFDQNGPQFCQIDLNINIVNFISYPSSSDNTTSLTVYFEDGEEETILCSSTGSNQMTLQKTLQYPIGKTIIGLYLKTVNTVPADQINPPIDYGAGGSACPLDISVDVGGHITFSLNEDAQLSTLLQRGMGCTNEYFHSTANSNISVAGMRLDYFGARYYDPEIGLWTAPDLLDQFWNTYSYTGGNPINLIDMWGLEGGSGIGESAEANGIGPASMFDEDGVAHLESFYPQPQAPTPDAPSTTPSAPNSSPSSTTSTNAASNSSTSSSTSTPTDATSVSNASNKGEAASNATSSNNSSDQGDVATPNTTFAEPDATGFSGPRENGQSGSGNASPAVNQIPGIAAKGSLAGLTKGIINEYDKAIESVSKYTNMVKNEPGVPSNLPSAMMKESRSLAISKNIIGKTAPVIGVVVALIEATIYIENGAPVHGVAAFTIGVTAVAFGLSVGPGVASSAVAAAALAVGIAVGSMVISEAADRTMDAFHVR